MNRKSYKTLAQRVKLVQDSNVFRSCRDVAVSLVPDVDYIAFKMSPILGKPRHAIAQRRAQTYCTKPHQQFALFRTTHLPTTSECLLWTLLPLDKLRLVL